MNELPKITPEIQKKIDATQAQQRKDDEVGLQAATSALPGPLRAAFSSIPEIKVGPFTVRRFVDGDFITLSELGHPLSSFAAAAEATYKFEPTGEQSWQMCWLMTRPRSEVKAKMKHGIEVAKEDASNVIGDELTPLEIGALLEAVVKQMLVYSGAHLQLEVKAEDENGDSPPPMSQP